MSKNSPTPKPTVKKQLRTTLGELLSAAYDAAGGSADSAAKLLSVGPLGASVRHRLRFV